MKTTKTVIQMDAEEAQLFYETLMSFDLDSLSPRRRQIFEGLMRFISLTPADEGLVIKSD